jgi:hypothetical protein
MIKRVAGILAVSTFFAFGCGDSTLPSPTQPLIRPTPTPSLVPVVRSVEPNTTHYFGDWIIHGSNFGPNPIATFESSGLVIRLDLEEELLSYVVVTVPRATAPGAYTPCIETVNGKGCGSFLVTVK